MILFTCDVTIFRVNGYLKKIYYETNENRYSSNDLGYTMLNKIQELRKYKFII